MQIHTQLTHHRRWRGCPSWRPRTQVCQHADAHNTHVTGAGVAVHLGVQERKCAGRGQAGGRERRGHGTLEQVRPKLLQVRGRML